MHILLPPSETKRSGGVPRSSCANEAGSRTELLSTHQLVRTSLDELMTDHESAVKALKLGVRSQDELQHNHTLDTGGVLPAIERYTGVLYDALSVYTLDDEARRWIDDHVSIQSSLFGLTSASTEIPAYRLSASTRLPKLGGALKSVWAPAHSNLWEALDSWVLDLRSKDYVALAPLPRGAGVFVDVKQMQPDGSVRSLNHFNKAAKGQLVRALAVSRPSVSSLSDMCDWLAGRGVDTQVTPDETVLSIILTPVGTDDSLF